MPAQDQGEVVVEPDWSGGVERGAEVLVVELVGGVVVVVADRAVVEVDTGAVAAGFWAGRVVVVVVVEGAVVEGAFGTVLEGVVVGDDPPQKNVQLLEPPVDEPPTEFESDCPVPSSIRVTTAIVITKTTATAPASTGHRTPKSRPVPPSPPDPDAAWRGPFPPPRTVAAPAATVAVSVPRRFADSR